VVGASAPRRNDKDACLVAAADRLDTGRILTLDSDFDLYR
jgi:predicted nucleic acid-binding protein